MDGLIDSLAPYCLRGVLGLVIGFCIGLTGIGGGVLVMPSLILLLHLPASVAVGTANLYACLCKSFGTYHHWKQRTISLRLSWLIIAGAVPVNLAVAVLITRHLSSLKADVEAWQQFQHGMKLFIAFVVLASAAIILLNALRRRTVGGSGLDRPRGLSGRPRTIAALALGALLGALIASTSVGGGVIVVPILIIVFGLSSAETVGSSILIAVCLTLVSTLVYGFHGDMDWRTAVTMAVGSLGGVPFGARLSRRLPDKVLEAIVAGIILLTGILMLVVKTAE